MSQDLFVTGVDFGTDSVRSVLISALNGQEISSSVFEYPRRIKKLSYNPAGNKFRQHPPDYPEGPAPTIIDCVKKAGGSLLAPQTKEISVDTAGLSLGSNAPEVFRANVKATCFDAKKFTDPFTGQGISVKDLNGMGGVAKKAPFFMQTMAGVLNMSIRFNKPIQVASTCAAGAAMFAATARGICPRAEDAMPVKDKGFDETCFPDPENITYTKRGSGNLLNREIKLNGRQLL